MFTDSFILITNTTIQSHHHKKEPVASILNLKKKNILSTNIIRTKGKSNWKMNSYSFSSQTINNPPSLHTKHQSSAISSFFLLIFFTILFQQKILCKNVVIGRNQKSEMKELRSISICQPKKQKFRDCSELKNLRK